MFINTKELIKLVEKPDNIVCRCAEANNSYGRFLFVDIHNDDTDECTSYYGAGYHEYRERYLIDEWAQFRSDNNKDLCLPKDVVVGRINQCVNIARRCQYGRPPQCKSAELFEELVDVIGDEDAVIAEMEDRGLI